MPPHELSKRYTTGVTLVELMITVAILGILAAVAVPLMNDYLETADQGVMLTNIETIRMMEESVKLADGTYLAGTYNPADPDTPSGLKTVLGWEPNTSDDSITYVVSNVTSAGFRISATNSAGESVCLNFPARTSC